MRTLAKSLVERILLLGIPGRVSRLVGGRQALILSYHNILPDGAEPVGERSMHLPERQLAEQLDILAGACRVLSLDHLLTSIVDGRFGPRPLVAVTFDDAYYGAVTIGIQQLVERELPGTIFIAPGCLGRKSFWWDELTNEKVHAVPQKLRSQLLWDHQGRHENIRRWAADKALPVTEPPHYAKTATEDELAWAARQPGVTLGSHSWSHPNLAALAGAELKEEMLKSHRWLSDRFDNVLSWLSYPYGISSPAVRETALELGYRGAVLTVGGRIKKGDFDPLRLPRLNVTVNLSLNGFRVRLAGLLPTRP